MIRKFAILLAALLMSCGQQKLPEGKLADEAEKEAEPRLDRFGDPLPKHALARMGTLRFRQQEMYKPLYCPDGKAIATYGEGNSIIFWDPETGKRLRSIAMNMDPIQRAALSRDGKVLASAIENGNVSVNEIASGKRLHVFKVPNITSCIAFSPNGKYLACAGISGWYQVWNLDTGRLAHQGTEWPEGHMCGVEFSSDGALLGVSSNSDHILLLKTESWKTLKKLSIGGTGFNFSPDSRHILSLGWSSLTWWDLNADKPIHQFKEDKQIFDVALHPNGKIAVTGSPFGYFKVWDLEAGKLLKKCTSPQNYVCSVLFSPDGTKLVTGSWASMELWDTSKWERLSHFDGPTVPAYLLRFADEGKRLVSFHNDQPHFQVRCWDVAKAKEISCVERHDNGLFQRALSGDGRWLVGWQGENRDIK